MLETGAANPTARTLNTSDAEMGDDAYGYCS
jgi:hypothetical protein